ncbi:TerD family protein [Prosthecobacter sp.]|uniref:TerD family protein n=1 Tax=Prosthecobacter sp. TaxID=1965333 RepID=UPI0037844F5E
MAINLTKGQRIDLKKSTGATLTDFCVGVNWGGIESRGFLGLTKKVAEVDLDLSAVLLDSQGKLCDHIYSPLYKPELLAKFGLPAGKLMAAGGALKHTGDDRAGDSGGDDGLDNEIITVNLAGVPQNVGQIFFFLNNCGQEDFSQIPYAKIRMFEGTPTRVKDVFASYNVAAEAQYKNRRALIMGRLYRKGTEWKFAAIGDATEDVFVGQTVARIAQEYSNM